MPELNQVEHDAPIAGQSLTGEFGARPWQSPPQYNTLEEVIEWYVPKLTNKAFTTELFDILEMGIPLTTIANTMQLTAVMQGVHSIDLGILVTPIIVEMLAYLADSQGVKYKVGDEEPEDDEIPTEGEIAAALNRLKEEDDKPIPVPGIDDNDEGLEEEEEEEPKGLMARRA